MKRKALKTDDGGHYFDKSDQHKVKFIKTGCVLLDCVLGGGWPLGRVSNIVGDKAVGKTLLAIEACANFTRQYPGGHIWYREAEAAFDEEYAESLGLPLESVDFGPDGIGTQWSTVDEIVADLEHCIAEAKDSGNPGLYIIDSLDALSSKAELERDADQGTYGLEKQKMLGQLFRRHIRDLKRYGIAILVISQVRDRIGIGFGDRYSRTGGKALDFYASIILWLSLIKTHKGTSRGIERATGIRVRAKCKKNKIAMPQRECDFDLKFGYGVDDMTAALEWLKMAKADGEIEGLDKGQIKKFVREAEEGGDYKKKMNAIRKVVRRVWNEIEEDFVPKRKKYT